MSGDMEAIFHELGKRFDRVDAGFDTVRSGMNDMRDDMRGLGERLARIESGQSDQSQRLDRLTAWTAGEFKRVDEASVRRDADASTMRSRLTRVETVIAPLSVFAGAVASFLMPLIFTQNGHGG